MGAVRLPLFLLACVLGAGLLFAVPAAQVGVIGTQQLPSNCTTGQGATYSSVTRLWACAAVGAGTVTSASVVTANGYSGTVATATTTPAITISGGNFTGVAAGYKLARGSTAFDGSNPTTVATGLTTVVACDGNLIRNTALSAGTAFVTHDTAVGANVDWYAWNVAGLASAGTEVFEWICIGT